MQGAQVARFPVAGDFGKIFRQPAVLVPPFLRFIQFCALVAACQDGYFASAPGKSAGQQFHHRGFPVPPTVMLPTLTTSIPSLACLAMLE